MNWNRTPQLAQEESPASSRSSTQGMDDLEDEPTWPRNWRAYRTLAGCFLLMFNSWGLVNAYGTFASFYMQHLLPNRDIMLLNLVGSTESFIVLAFSFVIGRLLDAGYARYLLMVGWVLVSLGMFTLSLSSGNGQYKEGNYGLIWVTQGFTTGLGMACFFVSSSQIAATWFIKRKSFAIGIVASGASIAGLVYPFMTKYLIGSLGFPNAVRAVAGLVSATALLSWLFSIPNPAHPLSKGDQAPWLSVRRWIDPPAFQNQTFNWFCASIAFMFFGFYAVFFNLEEWAANAGLGYKDRAPIDVTYHNGQDSETQRDGSALRTFIYLAVMNASSTIGRLSSGYLSDHYGALNVHAIVMLSASLLVYILWTLAKSVSSALAFVIIFGAVSGAVIGLPPATVAHIIHRSPGVDQSRLGQWTGMMYTLAAPFALTGPVIAGHLITKFDSYLAVQLWSGTCLFLASLCQVAAIYCARRGERNILRLTGYVSRAMSSFWTTDDEKSMAPKNESPTTGVNSEAVTREGSIRDERREISM